MTAVDIKALFEPIVEHIPVGVLVYHLEDPGDSASLRVLFLNTAAAAYIGTDPGPLLGKTILDAFPNLAETGIPDAFQQAVVEQVSVELGDVPYEDERVQSGVYNVQASPIGPEHLLVTFRNVTELRAAERARDEQLLSVEKMALLGSLLAGIAHEIRTPLAAISANAEMLAKIGQKLRKQVGDDDERAGKLLDMMDEMTSTCGAASSRMTELVGSLRRMGRADPPQPVAVSIDEIIDSTLLLLGHELKQGVDVVKELGECRPVMGRPGQLTQVFTNLVHNASQAMDGRGTVTVRTAMHDDDVVVEIEDEGCGIPQEDLAHIFESGFTTKEASVGTGLGLAISCEIVRAHRGRIDVESEVGKGTVFRVTLPASGD